ncbi:gamma-glutamyltransferase [Sphingomonas colocasiae]|uniref:Gamma-glutamyltransferase family protein n=1 Tax=Sphingomonas colocasiae TaxID=1848973 RepID=A0ABS7PUY1_9SPHN|nr:gamma-glutamyltransferase [Sphingomonas colocasiae]MBY8825173.1 gamma-glutamyltransferase family protein [Sphingomonas colocasiae]
MKVTRRTAMKGLIATGAATGLAPHLAAAASKVDLSPARWPKGEYDRFMTAQGVDRTRAGAARGTHGAVTVAYNGLAARAGLEALKQGGNAIDAVMTGALAQVALTMGAPISYFGIMSLVYHEAKTGKTYTMNAEWNTVRGESDPMSIPGQIDFSSTEALQGKGAPSGRTALVGGFMKGVEAAHRRFGKLPFASLFDPAIHIAEQGMPVTPLLDSVFKFRDKDIRRLPETRATLVKPDGSAYALGDSFRQPALARTLRAVARDGADYMYGGPWGERLIKAIQADGGKMTLEDLKSYRVIWADPLEAPLRGGYSVRTSPVPNFGGVSLIEAQNLADAAGLCGGEHWTKSSDALRKAAEITQLFAISMFPKQAQEAIYPGIDFSDAARVTKDHAAALWKQIEGGKTFTKWKRNSPMHSDDIVAIDSEGNIAAITHSINCVNWGKTGIFVDGISIGDPASFQQAMIARVTPGERLPAPTETGVLFKDGVPVLGFASMGAGLHQRTFQGLLNYTCFGMDVEEAINTADFYLPAVDPATGETTLTVPEGRFDEKVLAGTGLAWRVIPLEEARLGGEGKWVAISRDPKTGALHAASHNRNNSAAVAY